jgi:hypothetical protein
MLFNFAIKATKIEKASNYGKTTAAEEKKEN